MVTRGRSPLGLLVMAAILVTACGSPVSPAPSSFAPARQTPSASPSSAAVSPLVGQWKLKRSCAAIVAAFADAGPEVADALPRDVSGPRVTSGSHVP